MSPSGGCAIYFLFFIMTSHRDSAKSWPLEPDYWDNSRSTVNTATISPFREERVLNFVSLPVAVSRECLSDDGRRSGVCLNNYECKIQEGVASGNCALGFGVCCVFASTCGEEAYNNVTYFSNPNFPALSHKSSSCPYHIRKLSRQISQIRLDFVHFNLAQPNRQSGICETDAMSVIVGDRPEFLLCGLNSGEHVYLDVEDVKGIDIMINMTSGDIGRLWEVKITQIEFRYRAPTGCLQYYRGNVGTIRTMNFAVNGRHLAHQDYTICMRQEAGMCSIAYEPCDENSFKIGPASSMQVLHDDEGSGFGMDSEPRTDECTDRIVMPCDSEEFLMPRENIPGICDLLHCGNSFCNPSESTCRIESSTTPFNIHVHFGAALRNESPDDNLGMCLKYEQLPCS